MILLAYFSFLLVALYLARSRSPAIVLLALYVVSLACGIPLENDYPITTITDAINLLFVGGTLTMLIVSWRAFPFRVALAEPNEQRVVRLTWLLVAIHIVGMVVFSTALYAAVSTITDFTAFKNEGESAELYSALPIPHGLILLSIYLNWTAFFLVPLHLYHLHKRRYALSLLSLVLSLNLVLEGIAIFSRSSVILYVLLYLLYIPFFLGRFDRGQRRLLGTVGLVVLAFLGFVFYRITSNRFTEYLSWGDAAYSTSSIESGVLYSVLDYASQWYKNGNYVLSRYSFETLDGALSFPVVTTIANKFGAISYSPDAVPAQLAVLWGDRYDRFVGLVPNLVFDFGYAGTVLLVLCYVFVLRKLRPDSGSLSIAALLVLGPMFVLPAMGIQNSVMKLNGYNLLLLYSILVYAYLYSRPGSATKSLVAESDQR